MRYGKQVFSLSMGVFLSFSSIFCGYGLNEPLAVSSETTMSSQASYKTNDLVVLNEDCNGKEIVMTRGQMIKLSLKQDDDKYWAKAKNMNTEVLKSTFSYTTQEPGKVINEVFKTIGEGTSEIEFGYFSSTTKSMVGNFKVTITVKEENGIIVADESFNGKEVILNKGDKLKAAFYCSPGSHYPDCSKEPDSLMLKKIDNYDKICPLDPYPVATGGNIGYKYYVYEAIGEGTTDVMFGYPPKFEDTGFTVKVIDAQEPSYKTNDLVVLNEDSNGKEIVMTRGQMIKLSLKQDDDKYWSNKYVEQNVVECVANYTLQEPEKITNRIFKTIGEGTTVIDYGYYTSSKDKLVGSFKVTVTVKQPEGMIVKDSFFDEGVVLKQGDMLKVAHFYTSSLREDECEEEPNKSILKEIEKYSVYFEETPTEVSDGGKYGYVYYVYEAVGVGTTDMIYRQLYFDSVNETSITVKVTDDVQTTPTATPTPTNKTGNILDTNNDGAINMADIMPIAVRFGTRVGDWLYDKKYDFNKDGSINMQDVIMIAVEFGKVF